MNRRKAYLAVFVLTSMALSCAPSMATLDRTMSGRIHWPGGKEKPRISYLWSLQRVHGAEGGAGAVSRAVFGGPVHSQGAMDPDFLSKPHGVYVDVAGRLLIADSVAGRISVVDLSDMKSFQITGAGYVDFLTPIAVVAGQDGGIYISDAGLGKVGMYGRDGKFTRFMDGAFRRPTGLALDRTRGALYVADTWDHVIYIYDLDGRRLGSIGKHGEGEGEFNYPTHLAVGNDGTLYVSDTLNFRVQFFSPQGEFLGKFGIPGETYNAFDKIKGIAVDSQGHIYVTDSVHDMVKVFDPEGRLLLFFGTKGSFYGDFAHPAGIYIDDEDRIYVADSLNRRVQAFQFLREDQAVK
jgi:DNA-binding beta-propeller fold protein YncE